MLSARLLSARDGKKAVNPPPRKVARHTTSTVSPLTAQTMKTSLKPHSPRDGNSATSVQQSEISTRQKTINTGKNSTVMPKVGSPAGAVKDSKSRSASTDKHKLTAHGQGTIAVSNTGSAGNVHNGMQKGVSRQPPILGAGAQA